MKFEWDSNKNKSNKEKHGFSFEEAILVFDDPNSLRAEDLKHSVEGEKRFWQIGEDDLGEVLVVVFTMRENVCRIISARKAKKKERKQYEEYR